MPKLSSKYKNLAKYKQALRRLSMRLELKKQIRKGDDEQREEALEKLHKQKRNDSMSRVSRRCQSCDRPHAVYRKFGLCRICLRNALNRGDVPGARKSSW